MLRHWRTTPTRTKCLSSLMSLNDFERSCALPKGPIPNKQLEFSRGSVGRFGRADHLASQPNCILWTMRVRNRPIEIVPGSLRTFIKSRVRSVTD
jgi:hypothetical protein